jgi:signal peptidase I
MFAIRIFIAEPFVVSGSSMVPNFHNREYLVVDKISYRFHEPERGDVIIFRYPKDTSQYFIKRIIGLPGETIKIRDGIVRIASSSTSTTDYVLNEPYIAVKHRSDENFDMTLRTGEYFMMGDNRTQSSDSRTWGAMPRANIIGRALVRVLPVTSMALRPDEHPALTLTATTAIATTITLQ